MNSREIEDGQREQQDLVSVAERFDERVRAWSLDLERVVETETSLLGFGYQNDLAVVLKVVKRPGDEWSSGPVVRAFDGRGMLRVHEYIEGALLLERLVPGHSLVRLSLEGADDAAIDVVADVITRMTAVGALPSYRSVLEWGSGFTPYLAGDDRRIPRDVVEEGQRRFLALAGSQQATRLLHGDLHHSNILLDSTRGWLAIDPKGVVGETEYELGAVLRNPIERPEVFLSRSTVEKRLSQFANKLRVDIDRAVGWAFAQAVLSALWSIEDGSPVHADDPVLVLAKTIRPMLPRCL
jgi:streptomycin 6-kinase